MPALFAFGDKVVGRPQYTLFAAFGSFALIGAVEFGGRYLDRARSQLLLALCGAAAVVVGSLASQNAWLAALAMAAGSFAALFAGVVSSQIARASTSIVLPLIVATALPVPASQISDRLLGFATAAAVSLVADRLLWPVPTVDPLRGPTIAALRALARRLSGASDESGSPEVAALSRMLLATPFRPTGLSTQTRLNVRLVEELAWLDRALTRWPEERNHGLAAEVLVACADAIERRTDTRAIASALEALRTKVGRVQHQALADAERPGVSTMDFARALEPSFRAQELAFAVSAIAGTVTAAVDAARRSWFSTLVGRQAEPVALARRRASAHLDVNSVWLRNSLRAAVALGLATFVADELRVQHAFWVVFGALSVLRSNALSTGQFVSRAIVGTVVGFAIGAAIISALGTDTTPLWALLPVAVLVGGLAPIVVSFAVGQAAFTIVILTLFTIIAPQGWQLGVVRVEDVLLGCAVSLGVAILL